MEQLSENERSLAEALKFLNYHAIVIQIIKSVFALKCYFQDFQFFISSDYLVYQAFQTHA